MPLEAHQGVDLDTLGLELCGAAQVRQVDDEARREVAWTQLEKELVTGLIEQKSLASLWKSTTTLLARRIAERTSNSGEHYLTKTRAEQHGMFDSAAGGGALTAFLVLLKFFI